MTGTGTLAFPGSSSVQLERGDASGSQTQRAASLLLPSIALGVMAALGAAPAGPA